MAGFATSFDIANRALQHCRAPRILNFADGSLEANETGFAYDKIRRRELQRNLWVCATRRAILRPMDSTTQWLTAPAWASGTAYVVGDFVAYNNQLWVCQIANTGQTPGVVPANGVLYWDSYFGSIAVDIFEAPINPDSQSTAGSYTPTSYYAGELVYTTPGDGTYTVYRSLVNGNTNTPSVVDTWDNSTQYTAGQVVSFNSTNYQSLVNLNVNYEPDLSPSQWTTTVTSPLVSNSWRVVTSATLTPAVIDYPLGVGPASDTRTRNAFRLPYGFLRQAPDDPKAGINPFLGSPVGNMQRDWVFEGKFIISSDPEPIMLRFVADVQDVTTFDDLFCEGLAATLGQDIAPRICPKDVLNGILATTAAVYRQVMSDARIVNGIEAGFVEPPEDDIITCRL